MQDREDESAARAQARPRTQTHPTSAEARRAAAWARRLEVEAGWQREGGWRRRLWSRIRPDSSLRTQQAISAFFLVLGLRGRGRRNALDVEVRGHRLPVRRLPAAFEGYRILHLSDLHLDSLPEFPAYLADRISGLEYDACVVTGDLRYLKRGGSGPALDGFRLVRERIRGPIHMVLGNHDSAAMLEPLEALDVRVLVNEATVLERGGARVHLVGVDDPHWFRTHDLEAALDGVPESECRILLAHSPEIYREAEARGIDLLLCGHTHGGQIALPGGWTPFLNVRCLHRYAVRDWTFGRLRGYTTVGAGCSSIPLRFQVRPEVVVHRLEVDPRSEG